ncbi:MAG: substrate-binding domain-containing protein [Deltaproteobacteria bacterium]|nr:substrate-binding domain-containing protein [Deltaproteobacteria bacterium]
MFRSFNGLCALLFVFFADGMTNKARATETRENRVLILATTTSSQDSGLLDLLLPHFQEKTGYLVKTIAVGSGQALAIGRRGDADVLLVHAPDEEKMFIANGHGVERRSFMYNYFVLAGVSEDPAGVSKTKSVPEAFRRIADSKTLFLSRGDESGTHIMEQRLWHRAGVRPSGRWYQQSGQGMGPTLIIAAEKKAYVLTDRSTYLRLKKRIGLKVLLDGDSELLNIYSLIRVNSQKSSRINVAGGKAFFDFMLSRETMKRIETFGVEKFGEPLFGLIKQ